ncbi:MAG: hypothetical protein N2746_08505 [Deltaproteobacteria bacterium]|nr:hypothetical protein [Deltaproteobacteria bacterium]
MKIIRKRNTKRRYIRPTIKFRSSKRQMIVAVSCQKIWGESEYCNIQPGG